MLCLLSGGKAPPQPPRAATGSDPRIVVRPGTVDTVVPTAVVRPVSAEFVESGDTAKLFTFPMSLYQISLCVCSSSTVNRTVITHRHLSPYAYPLRRTALTRGPVIHAFLSVHRAHVALV